MSLTNIITKQKLQLLQALKPFCHIYPSLSKLTDNNNSEAQTAFLQMPHLKKGQSNSCSKKRKHFIYIGNHDLLIFF